MSWPNLAKFDDTHLREPFMIGAILK